MVLDDHLIEDLGPTGNHATNGNKLTTVWFSSKTGARVFEGPWPLAVMPFSIHAKVWCKSSLPVDLGQPSEMVKVASKGLQKQVLG